MTTSFDPIQILQERTTTWEGVRAQDYRYGGTEFTLGTREIGHVSPDGLVAVVLNQTLRDQLIKEGKAAPHPIYPDSAWVSCAMHTRADLHRALWLLQVAYLYQRICHAPSTLRDDLVESLRGLNLSAELRAAFNALLPAL